MRAYYADYLQNVDTTKRILEIGPLVDPLFTKDTTNIFYADIRDTESIRAFYQDDPDVDVSRVCPIDYVIQGSYTESLKGVEKFDYVMSSHVLEHMPRLIEHFQDIANIISDNGRLYLFIPDHRYCFDHARCPTSFAEAYVVHTQKIANHPLRVLDHMLETLLINDPTHYFLGKGMEGNNSLCSMEHAMQQFAKAMNGEYVDVHFSVFSPSSFLVLMQDMISAKLLPFSCVSFFPTPPYAHTFGIVLQKCPEMLENEECIRQEQEKLRAWRIELNEKERVPAFTWYDRFVCKMLLKILPVSSALRKEIRRRWRDALYAERSMPH